MPSSTHATCSARERLGRARSAGSGGAEDAELRARERERLSSRADRGGGEGVWKHQDALVWGRPG